MGTTRKRDGAAVVRLRVELPGLRPEEVTVSTTTDFVSILAMQIGEIKYKAECACQRPDGYVLLSSKFHLSNYTLTLVWGPPEAKQYDEMMAAKAAEQAKAAEEAMRIQLSNDVMFDIDCSDDD